MWNRWTRTQPGLLAAQSDESLLPALARGDEEAFLAVYRRRQSSVFRYALHVSGDADVAAEAVQETFMALLRDASRLDPSRGTLIAWLFAVARNQVLRQLRSRNQHLSLDDDEQAEPAAAGCVLADLEQEQLSVRVREMMATLPAVYREVLVLCDMQDLSYEEVAAIAGCPTGTVRSRLHRARALLAGKLRPLVRTPS
ncbi:MAG: sigma-70 family RNA polymerase sigma factor [Bryobacterales bacterium]|nr:sigma-70 family RNA polymerase sigma factor [Bryobacterales bacterium]